MYQRTESILEQVNRQLEDETIEQIRKRRGGKLRFPVYSYPNFVNADLAELELSVRAYNGLKRAGYHTVSQLVEHISGTEDLACIRNLGKKSIDEIMMKLFLFHYSVLGVEEQRQYVKRIIEMNR